MTLPRFNAAIAVLVLAVAVLGAAAAYHFHHVQTARTWSRALARAVQEGRPSVSLRDLPAPAWDRVHVFGPFTSRSEIAKALGFDWRGSAARAIERADHAVLLVFLHQGNLALAVMHPRDRGDFVPAGVGRAYTADDAVFRIQRRTSDGWVLLEPEAGRGPVANPPSREGAPSSAAHSPHHSPARP